VPRVRFIVSFELPPAATIKECREYVEDAVSSMKGSREPPNQDNCWTGDPVWGIDSDTITVTHIRKSRGKRS